MSAPLTCIFIIGDFERETSGFYRISAEGIHPMKTFLPWWKWRGLTEGTEINCTFKYTRKNHRDALPSD